ncbi:MAG TPA: ATP-binding cassette domain-containing protein [Gaiellaceae bacterium]|nr:ATP-binding cassette domain-containing protein [Gaiellaceae bacterium]
MTVAVEVDDVFRVYATEEGTAAALQGLSLRILDGEVVAVLGPSGSGKTTLLRILAGLDRPSAGQVRAFGVDLRRLRGRRLDRYRSRLLGYADQRYSEALAPELTVGELVSLRLTLAGEPGRERRRRAQELLDQVGLAPRADAYPHELSGGEQQRVALCAALAHGPRLLLADEPTGELDTSNAAVVYELIGELARAQGTTVLVVSHDPGSASIADRVVHIRDGRVAAESARQQVDDEEIVVARGGWLRLPEELLRRSGISDKARARLAERSVLIESTDQTSASSAEPRRVFDPGPTRGSDGVAVGLEDVEARVGRDGRGRTVFSGLTASVEPGRLTVVTGPSGSGKSTLLHLIAGLHVPAKGDVVVLGTRLSKLDREQRAGFRRDQLALVAQEPPLVSFLSAQENVELALGLRGLDDEASSTRAREALAAVGLEQLAGQRISRLSTGEQERVAIARALAAAPALLLADEPTARLDQANALAIGELLARIARERGVAVVCATHDPVVIEQADAELPLA